MIISRTPLRVSLLGGGSDLPAFYREEAGAIIGTAINKYIYITTNPKFDNKIRASYSVTEIVDKPEQLRHELIRSALQMLDVRGGIEITSISDVPSHGTGLGSSSSYTVGLLNALHASLGQHAGADRLARESCRIEIEECGKPIGKQDQYLAAFGGLQHIRFEPDGAVFVDPVIVGASFRKTLESHFLLLYTGIARSASEILEEQSIKIGRSSDSRAVLRTMVGLAEALVVELRAGSLDRIGELLNAGWMAKRNLASGITSPAIDAWYEQGLSSGATGGKLLGAGGGGFLLFFAPPEKHDAIATALPELRRVPFRFEPQGSKIIYVEEQEA